MLGMPRKSLWLVVGMFAMLVSPHAALALRETAVAERSARSGLEQALHAEQAEPFSLFEWARVRWTLRNYPDTVKPQMRLWIRRLAGWFASAGYPAHRAALLKYGVPAVARASLTSAEFYTNLNVLDATLHALADQGGSTDPIRYGLWPLVRRNLPTEASLARSLQALELLEFIRLESPHISRQRFSPFWETFGAVLRRARSTPWLLDQVDLQALELLLGQMARLLARPEHQTRHVPRNAWMRLGIQAIQMRRAGQQFIVEIDPEPNPFAPNNPAVSQAVRGIPIHLTPVPPALNSAAGMEEDPIAAALKQGPATIAVDGAGVARLNGQAVAIPPGLQHPGFFTPNSRTMIIIPREAPWMPAGISVFDQAGIMNVSMAQQIGIGEYHDLRNITTPMAFSNILFMRGDDEDVVIFHRTSIALPDWTRKPNWLTIGLPPQYAPVGEHDIFALCQIARMADGVLAIGAVVERQFLGHRVLLIAA